MVLTGNISIQGIVSFTLLEVGYPVLKGTDLKKEVG